MSARSAAIAAALAGLVAIPRAAGAGDCTITSVAPVAFGTYDRFDPSPADSTGGITFACSGVGGADAVRLELDRGAAGSFAPRTLVAGPLALAYNLYLDAARTVVWGDGTGGSSAYGPVTPAEGSTTVPIYGRIPAGQGTAAGAYGDTVTVTLQF